MRRFWALLLLTLAGCSGWQPTRGSQAVDVDPWAIGAGGQAITPSNAPGFINGEPQDMRTR